MKTARWFAEELFFRLEQIDGGSNDQTLEIEAAFTRAISEARAEEREACAALASPYHTTAGVNGCPRFCGSCERSRQIRDKIRARTTGAGGAQG